MTMAAWTLDHPRDRTLLWTMIISLAVHIVVLAPGIRKVIPKDFFDAQAMPVVVPSLEFDLVSPPANPVPTDQISRFRSTVSSAASDDVNNMEESDLPHSEGEIPIVDNPTSEVGAEGGGKSELPPLPEERADLAEAFRRSKFLDISSPSPKASLREQIPQFDNSGSVRASFGGISVNTTAWDFAPYLLELKHRIKQHWIPPFAFTALGAVHGYTKVNFRIYPDGRMQALSVIEEEGHDSLHRASANAIKGAAPFRPLPEDFPEDYLDITFGFYYLLPGDAERYFRKDHR